jgi:2-oxoglutarate ferredoxin oxidoreductase subunit beta
VQGDGDLANEGLQEAIHAAARGETITCFMLNNGVFGETGGHMTTTTVPGQRTKSSVDGREASRHGHPLRVAELLAGIDGAAYVARGAVNSAGNVARTKRMITRALRTQIGGEGFSFVEILTMCPTGWFIETQQAPEYIDEQLAAVHPIGVLRDVHVEDHD